MFIRAKEGKLAPTTPLPVGCGYCGSKANLKFCGACKTVVYCSRDHQLKHYNAHKTACYLVAESRERYWFELEQITGDCGGPANLANLIKIFGADYLVIHFYLNGFTNSCRSLVRALRLINNRRSVKEQLRHCMDMLEVMRADETGLRFHVPSLMIRLNKDQQCFDFMKWYAKQGSRRQDSWCNPSLPFLDIKSADGLEDPGLIYNVKKLNPMSQGVNTAIVLALLKLRLIFDLQTLQAASQTIGRFVPFEILYLINRYVIRSGSMAQKRRFLEELDHTEEITRQEGQVMHLLKTVQQFNSFIWPAVIACKVYPLNQTCEPGSQGEARVVVTQCGACWFETPGAIDYLKKQMADLETLPSTRMESRTRLRPVMT
ncbi:hypothetical protein BO71DRAFT_430056 [Aspergillus ellipticus CBS 707.79]|uniref:MYND-type domain-containing protein n=1 Tax=Aspergillus ellipticus CBS 707.79 TaxID=1448320 RepID=A0A319DB07_9EURO|nr:hypothetical protein BO71DRAFT_430056 [Aspergillus ellipticus CBS 707.79]